ncbi:MAG: MazG nucleotide pyrophosphohydrolase domain-containing protein [Nanoarchaeota archaeon]|nr:MazG nucleotide pyrophosphohydrolase domain-containing protein [Nanoarchaeota archaeon]
MDIKELQKKMMANAKRYGEEFNVPINEEFVVVKIMEEVGEFAEAILRYRKHCRPHKYVSNEEARRMLGEELADIVGIALVGAELFDIDLDLILQEKWVRRGEAL